MEHVISVVGSKETTEDVREATTSQNVEERKPINSQSSVELTNCTLDPSTPTCKSVHKPLTTCNSLPIPTCSQTPATTCGAILPPTSQSVFLKNITQLDLRTISVPLILLRNSLSPPELARQSPECEVSSSINPTETLTVRSPPTLFQQALAGLNQTSISSSMIMPNQILSHQSADKAGINLAPSPEVSTPNSLTSAAPPSYSFVLRQINAQRRPRLMGTFIPSPSFVHHAPPPNYAAAFDIYIDSPPPIPFVHQRTCQFSYTPMNIICSECGFGGTTAIKCKVTIWTHLCAIVLCLMCCWVCAPLPYLLNSCKNVFHYCKNCRTLLGMYSPSNPDNNPHLG